MNQSTYYQVWYFKKTGHSKGIMWNFWLGGKCTQVPAKLSQQI